MLCDMLWSIPSNSSASSVEARWSDYVISSFFLLARGHATVEKEVVLTLNPSTSFSTPTSPNRYLAPSPWSIFLGIEFSSSPASYPPLPILSARRLSPGTCYRSPWSYRRPSPQPRAPRSWRRWPSWEQVGFFYIFYIFSHGRHGFVQFVDDRSYDEFLLKVASAILGWGGCCGVFYPERTILNAVQNLTTITLSVIGWILFIVVWSGW